MLCVCSLCFCDSYVLLVIKLFLSSCSSLIKCIFPLTQNEKTYCLPKQPQNDKAGDDGRCIVRSN